MDALQNFMTHYQPKIKQYQDFAESFSQLKIKVLQQRQINLDNYTHDITIRETKAGYKMSFHRDNYLLRRFKQGNHSRHIFIPFNNRPKDWISIL